MSTHASPIGAFDSGVGGLTVVQAMRQLLPAEDILYLGDTARVPYGNKSPETIIRYSLENLAFLSRNGVKAVVVACNTASAHALAVLQKVADIPVIGVIAPGVEAALAATRNGRMGVVGTQGTIQSAAYQNLLRQLRPDVVITAVAAPLLVSLVEEDWLQHPATRLILEEYFEPMRDARVDTVVLACTHYPLLKPLAQACWGRTWCWWTRRKMPPRFWLARWMNGASTGRREARPDASRFAPPTCPPNFPGWPSGSWAARWKRRGRWRWSRGSRR